MTVHADHLSHHQWPSLDDWPECFAEWTTRDIARITTGSVIYESLRHQFLIPNQERRFRQPSVPDTLYEPVPRHKARQVQPVAHQAQCRVISAIPPSPVPPPVRRKPVWHDPEVVYYRPRHVHTLKTVPPPPPLVVDPHLEINGLRPANLTEVFWCEGCRHYFLTEAQAHSDR